MIVRATIALGILILAACRSEKSPAGERYGGTVVIAVPGNYGSLFPLNTSTTTGRQVTELVYDYLTEVSLSLNTTDDRTFAPRLAKSWEWSSDSLSLAVHLHPDARWHDGEPVRSSDVTYSYSMYSDTSHSSMAAQLEAIDSVTARDSLTAVFWFKRRYPLQFYDATSQMQILPRHIYGKISKDSIDAAVSGIKPVGTGRYRFVKETSGESIEIEADTANFRGSPNISRIIWRKFGSADEAARALLSGEADIYDAMRSGDVAAAANNPDVKVLMSPGSDYAFMVFNVKDPLFASRDLRRALSMAVDREALVRNVFDSLAIPGIGPTVSYLTSTSKTLSPLPYDPQRAARLLDSMGWRINQKTGIRSNAGRELRFKAILPTSSSNRIKMGTLLQEQFRKIGVALEPDQLDIATFNSKLSMRDFEAALASWHLGTSPASIRILWTTTAQNNLGSYSSSKFDALVDSAIQAFDRVQSNDLYSRAYQIAIDDAPAIWLYEPRMVIGVHKRIRTRAYRPDAWWWSFADWYIPSVDQIERDRVR